MVLLKIILLIIGVVVVIVVFCGIIYIIMKLVEYEVNYIEDLFDIIRDKISKKIKRY